MWTSNKRLFYPTKNSATSKRQLSTEGVSRNGESILRKEMMSYDNYKNCPEKSTSVIFGRTSLTALGPYALFVRLFLATYWFYLVHPFFKLSFKQHCSKSFSVCRNGCCNLRFKKSNKSTNQQGFWFLDQIDFLFSYQY